MFDALVIVEGSAFVSAPLGGTIMAGTGADVIRFDPIGGGIDHDRWPTTPDGFSLYWAGLNQGKRSVALDVSSDEGRDLALSLAATPGDGGGIALTNHPAGSWFSYEALTDRRADIIMCHIEGHADGRPAVDYTVNAATGLPLATGPAETEGPINSVLPAWDIVTGHLAVIGLLAAERARRISGTGDCVRIALADVAFGVMGHLGFVVEGALLGRNRPRLGNGLYGAFGRDFETQDGQRVMIVAITGGQFQRLVKALGIEERIAGLERQRGAPLHGHEDLVSVHDQLAEFVAGPWSAAGAGFTPVDQPGAGTYPMPPPPIRFDARPRRAPARAPLLGEHTGQVLEELLGLTPLEIGRLHDRRVIAGPG